MILEIEYLKYHITELLSFTRFLDCRWKGWHWFNVYDRNTEDQTGKLYRQVKAYIKMFELSIINLKKFLKSFDQNIEQAIAVILKHVKIVFQNSKIYGAPSFLD